jgi:hypothetical protein
MDRHMINNMMSAAYGKQLADYSSTDSVLSKMAQFVLALLIIFVWAYAITAAESEAKIDQAKGIASAYREENDRIMSTDKGILVKEKEEAVDNLQRFKLLNAIDRYYGQERLKLSLSIFTKVVDNDLVFDMKDVLQGTKIINSKFVDGCKYANSVFVDKTKYAREWQKAILRSLGFRLQHNRETVFASLEVIKAENEDFLEQEIGARIERLIEDMVSMQWKATDFLTRFFSDNLERIESNEIAELLARFERGEVTDIETYANQLDNLMKKHLRRIFLQHGVQLLNEVQEAY